MLPPYQSSNSNLLLGDDTALDPKSSIVVWTHNHLLFMQEMQFYFTKLTIISLCINDVCVLVSLIPMGPAESAYLSNILSLGGTSYKKPELYI